MRTELVSDSGWNEVIAGRANNQPPRRAGERERVESRRTQMRFLASAIRQYARIRIRVRCAVRVDRLECARACGATKSYSALALLRLDRQPN